MATHFTAAEFEQRRQAALASMADRGLDALLMFRQESMYYLSGFDTFGFCFFQCLVLTPDEGFTLLTRAPDLRQARHTSIIEDIRIWVDEAGRNPAGDLLEILKQRGLAGKRVGVEYDAYGLTAYNGRRLDDALAGFCELEDASTLVSELRVIKSAAEIEYVRRAAELADDALDAAVELCGSGMFEGDILAAMQGAVFRGGGDYPGNEYIIGSGDDALLCRYFSGRRHLSDADQLTLEHAGVYRHYHACLMRTLLVGEPHEEHVRMHAACVDAMDACMTALKPGGAVGDVFSAHARVLDAAGFEGHRLNACGYSLGATFTPTWMDFPMFYAKNSVVVRPNMVFFIHIILMNSEARRAMTLGQTVQVTESGCERLSRAPLDLVVK